MEIIVTPLQDSSIIRTKINIFLPTCSKMAGGVFEKLEFTDNNLADAVKMIKDGNIIAIHTVKACRVFSVYDHPDLLTTRVVYLDCNSMPGLLDDGEWEYSKRRGAQVNHRST